MSAKSTQGKRVSKSRNEQEASWEGRGGEGERGRGGEGERERGGEGERERQREGETRPLVTCPHDYRKAHERRWPKRMRAIRRTDQVTIRFPQRRSHCDAGRSRTSRVGTSHCDAVPIPLRRRERLQTLSPSALPSPNGGPGGGGSVCRRVQVSQVTGLDVSGAGKASASALLSPPPCGVKEREREVDRGSERESRD